MMVAMLIGNGLTAWMRAAGLVALVGMATVAGARAPKAGEELTFTGKGIAVQAVATERSFDGLQVLAAGSQDAVKMAEVFRVRFTDGTTASSATLRVLGKPAVAQVKANPGARVAAERVAGQRMCADFVDGQRGGSYHWCLVMRTGAQYFRETVTIEAGKEDLPIAEVRLLDFMDAGARVSGTVKGSPITDGGMFFGFEHPLSAAAVTENHATAWITRVLPLKAGQSVSYSAVVGAVTKGQLRRDFLAYVEMERPRGYGPFLHYNSWFDLGYGNNYDEAGALDRVNAFGQELHVRRGVQLDSYLFDDGWDDPNTLWGFHQGFPDGFTKVAAAAKKYDAGIGVWFSPWGGYWYKKEARIKFGKANGYEIVKDGFALSGNRYYAKFEERCLEMVTKYGVNQFKFDGTGNADAVFPGSVFDSDFDAAIHLIGKLRDTNPGIFINLTTGTYPSPFWLRYADSIWRGGDDTGFAGVGTNRQQWITYRDGDTYEHVVQAGPLYPLNSLMLHGLVYAKQAEKLGDDPGKDFADEVESYFGGGTQLQEMYITPSLLTTEDWNVLAAGAKWSRARAGILKDVHWIGGDPKKGEVYGWAAWSPEGWVVTLRNPADHSQEYHLVLGEALELPEGAKGKYTATHPFAVSGGAAVKVDANEPLTVHLGGFEVTTLEWVRGSR